MDLSKSKKQLLQQSINLQVKYSIELKQQQCCRIYQYNPLAANYIDSDLCVSP